MTAPRKTTPAEALPERTPGLPALFSTLTLAAFMAWIATGSTTPSRPDASQRALALPNVFVVSHPGDAGEGSLRSALEAANETPNALEADRVLFRIPGPGPHVIYLSAELPEITEPVIIDGTTQEGSEKAQAPGGEGARLGIVLDGTRAGPGARGLIVTGGGTTVRGLWIRGFEGDAVRIERGGDNTIEGNRLGTGKESDPAKEESRGNGGSGLAIIDSSHNRVGGDAPETANLLTGNAGHGILVAGASSRSNRILGNAILANGKLGIALRDGEAEAPPAEADFPDADREKADPLDEDSGPNDRQNAPVLESAANVADDAGRSVRLKGRLESGPDRSYRIEFFATHREDLGPQDPKIGKVLHPDSPPERRSAGTLEADARISFGERLIHRATVRTGQDGTAEFLIMVPGGLPAGDWITATATDPEGNTSELGNAEVIAAAVISWNNAAGGNWGVAANWSPALIPGASDTADITLAGTYTVVLNVTASIASLNLGGASGTQTLSNSSMTLTLAGASTINANGALLMSGGTLNGAGDLTSAGPITWTGGSLAGTGVLTVNAGMTLTTAGTKSLAKPVTLNSLATWDQGAFSFFTGAVLNIG
ncbi:MAG: right-handed parallel beta-helix repeat-containing protein, partial [Acidobacteria bacterium]|nr:right-handed parallel beta-helix repeat-containing protein [Acidobacteriota bacterium]